MPARNLPDPDAAKPCVLVIDDDEAVALAIAARLGHGFRVVGLSDPRMGVTAAREVKPDVILCDIRMPRMQGDEVAYALSQDPATAGIPLIYLTALMNPEETSDLEGVFGDHPALSKGASPQELVDCVTSALARGGPEPELPFRPL